MKSFFRSVGMGELVGLSILALIFSLMGCTPKIEAAPDAESNKEFFIAKSSEEALARLTPAQRETFEKWKASPLKRCNAADPFGMKPAPGIDNEGQGYDLSLILERNQGSLIVSDEATGEIAFLRASAPTRKYEQRISRDQIRSVALRNEMTCTISLFGAKLYEGYFVNDLGIGAYFNPTRDSLPALGVVQPLQWDKPSGMAEVQSTVWTQALSQAFMTDNAKANALLSRKLGFKEEDTQRITNFNFSGFDSQPTVQYALKIADNADSLWSGPGASSLIAPIATMEGLFDGSAHSFSLEWRMTPAQVKDSKNIANRNDESSLSFKVNVDLEPSQDNAGQMELTVSSMESQGRVALNEQDAAKCVRGRAEALRGLRQPRPKEVTIGVQEVFGPCESLSRNVQKSKSIRKNISEGIPFVLGNVRPSPQANYAGWDALVIETAIDILNRDGDILQELDPKSATTVIPAIVAMLNQTREAMGGATEFNVVKNEIFTMSMKWALRGRTVNTTRQATILNSIKSVAAPFTASTKTLLAQLGEDPDSQEDALTFASTVDAEYITSFNKAVEANKAAGLRFWEDEMRPRVLQTRFALKNLQNTARNWETVNKKLKEIPALAAVKQNLTNLLAGRFPIGTPSSEQIDTLMSALNNTAELFPQSTQNLVAQVGNNFESQKDTLDFAIQMSSEYKSVAAGIISTAKDIGLENWATNFFANVLQTRPTMMTLANKRAAVLAAADFTTREKARIGDIKKDPQSENARVGLIYNALSDSWTAEDYVLIEQLAAIARTRSGCKFAGVARTTQCTGSPLFNKAGGNFLDPQFQGRYGLLAGEFAKLMETMTPPGRYMQVRSMMSGSFLGLRTKNDGVPQPIWSVCKADQVQAKLATLQQQIKKLTTPEPIEPSAVTPKKQLEREIRNTLKNCQANAGPAPEGLNMASKQTPANFCPNPETQEALLFH